MCCELGHGLLGIMVYAHLLSQESRGFKDQNALSSEYFHLEFVHLRDRQNGHSTHSPIKPDLVWHRISGGSRQLTYPRCDTLVGRWRSYMSTITVPLCNGGKVVMRIYYWPRYAFFTDTSLTISTANHSVSISLCIGDNQRTWILSVPLSFGQCIEVELWSLCMVHSGL